eukprot:TRINITY_DN1145_c0_g1_i1.p1 TRINITY_DN1145_c0_g1~~TRINITY_DN1145_c0_g1_i1.p1  ORF type:complete len:547 (-),score=134.64 TRINITY_DN1145_c0_g1_i1:149-1702(-)
MSVDDKRPPGKRIFVNRSLTLEKIKFYGFDMDYTLAEYKSEEYENLGFELVKERLIQIGYPKEISSIEYKPSFPVRGLWWDSLHGNMLKVDGFGNILFCCHGLKFLKADQISVKYPNKFLQLDDSRIYVYNTLFNLPEIYLLACLIDFFQNKKDYKEVKDGFKQANLHMSFKSLFQDVRGSVDHIHMHGALKPKTCEDLPRYIKKDGRLAQVLYNLQKSGAKTFLLTNSDWDYSNKVMEYLLDCPDAPHKGKSWQSYFDFTFVDARKPRFFGEGTVLRQVDKTTGQLSIGTHTGNLDGSGVYSGGSSEVISKLIGAKGRDVLYVGDHIFGDVLKSKKLRGWRTFLIVPELNEELSVWTNKQQLYSNLQRYDHQLTELYRDMDSGNMDRPNVAAIKSNIQATIHSMEMSYGTTGSLFRSGSRQTFFAAQVVRYADIYAASVLNLLYYPTCFMFRSSTMLLPHESTVAQGSGHSEQVYGGDTMDRNGISNGEEPSHTHDMDDDDIDEMDEQDSSSEHSN